jgi:2-C-methyl-D-erythritol 4-phosphate cytidylyltransferase/2-C-methyl-D-erythritol 2,4-cyclodiphosphate synthase
MLDVPASRISTKATTTEKMGFTGRGEGIAAYAVVTVKLPAQDQQAV